MPDLRFNVVVDQTELDRARREIKQVERELLRLGQQAPAGAARSAIEARLGTQQRVPALVRQLKDIEAAFRRIQEARRRALDLGGVRIQASQLDVPTNVLKQVAGTEKPLFGQLDLDQALDAMHILAQQAAGVHQEIEKWKTSSTGLEPQIAGLQKRLQELENQYKRIQAARDRALTLGQKTIKVGDVDPTLLKRTLGQEKFAFGRIDLDQAFQLLQGINTEAQDVAGQLNLWASSTREVAQELAQSLLGTRELSENVRNIALGTDRPERIAGPEAVNLAVQERLNRLLEEENRLLERRQALEQGILQAVGGKEALTLQRQLVTLREQERAAAENLNKIILQRQAFQQRLNESGERSVQLFLDQVAAAREGVALPTPTAETFAGDITAEELANLQRFVELRNRETAASQKLAEVRGRLEAPTQTFENIALLSGTGLERTQALTREIQAVDEQIAALAGPGRAREIDFIAPGLLERVQRLQQVLQDIQTLREQGRLERTTTTGLEEQPLVPDAQRALANLERLRDSLVSNIASQNQELATSITNVGDVAQRELTVAERAAERLRQAVQARADSRAGRAVDFQSVEQAVAERVNALEQARNQLLERREAQLQRILSLTDEETVRGTVQKLVELRSQEAAAAERINQLLSARQTIEHRLRQSQARGVQLFLEQAEAAREAGGVAEVPDFRRRGFRETTTQDREAIRELISLETELLDTESQLARTRSQLAEPTGGFVDAAQAQGSLQQFKEVNQQLASVEDQLNRLTGPGRADEIVRIAPGLLERMQRLRDVLREISDLRSRRDANLATDEDARRLSQLAQEREKLTSSILRQQQELSQVDILPSVDTVVQQLPFLERTLINAFRGFGRRFQATLQFAISGAFLFSLQRFAREAFETAIEVERAFEDIATALEFDIAAGRGTADFERSLEGIRIGILQIADEFNVLPTQANEVAFAMVSRFRDADNALAATRAQLLALKVSTIDADEIIRALTATSEAFAASVFNANEQLELQERLLRRETAAAQLQLRAMDLATQIQQEWGVTLEDTIEGTGRSAEVFRQLGFSLEETSAIVAAVSFQLGQTGTNVAERLNRSIGQITSPQIRDELLELAAASEAFTLTFKDFESGATALEALSAQFERLQIEEPETARQIAQIVGQRREIEVVSAVLGSRDLQRQIVDSADEAVGAAERRFEFLRETTQEILASIGEQFQELAQNLERLGALSPFKALLKSADLFLNIINEILKGVNGLLSLIRQIPLVGNFFAEALPNVIAFSAALSTVLRTLKAIASIEAVRVGRELVGSLLGAARGGGGGVVQSGLIDPRTNAPFQRAQQQAVQSAALLSLFTQGAANSIQSFGRIAEKVGNGFFKSVDAIKNFRLSMVANAAATAQNTKAQILNSAALTAQQRAALTFFGSLTKIGLILGGLAFIGTNLFESWKAVDEVAKSYRESLAQLERATRRQLALGQINEQQAEIQRLENEREAWRRAADSAADSWATATDNVVGSLTQGLLNVFSDIEDPQIEEILAFEGVDVSARDNEEAARSFIERLLAPGLDQEAEAFWNKFFALAFPTEARRATIEGSEEFVAAQEGIATKGIVSRLFSDLEAEILDFAGKELPPEAREAGEALSRRLAGVRGIIETGTGPDATEEEINAAESALEDLQELYERFLFVLGLSAEQLELTIKQAREKIQQITRDLEFGRITPGDAAAGFDQVREEALAKAVELEGLGTPDALARAKEFRRLADDALASQSQAISEQTEQRIAVLEAFASDEQRLIGTIEAYRREVERQRTAGNFAALRTAQQNLIAAEKELNQYYFDRLQEEARFREQQSDSIEERAQILDELAKELLKQAIADLVSSTAGIDPSDRKFFDLSGALERFREALRVIQGIQKEADDSFDEIQIRQEVNAILRGGPALDDLTRLQSDLAGLRLQLVQAKDGTIEALEILQEIRVVTANIAQEVLRRAASAALLQAGVNDSILQLKAQISINAKELELTADLYGEQSTQFLDLKLKQEQLKNQLANALLELRDLNRRLDSDITNSFEQAQLDLVQVLEKLAAPDLGELERARLELEKKNAEAAAKRAFFDQRLFDLEFLFETGEIGISAYIAGLEALLETVDISTQQGKEIFLQIQKLIEGLQDDATDMQFNIPTEIRLPTLFEVRRSLAADQLGVNYQDNREQNITIQVDDSVDLEEALRVINEAYGQGSARLAPGGAGITIGGF